MNIHTATEEAYKNGYEDAVKDFAEWLVKRSNNRIYTVLAEQFLGQNLNKR